MNEQDAFLALVGGITVSDILILILGLGYILPRLKKAWYWLRDYFHGIDRKEQASQNIENLEHQYQKGQEERKALQKQIETLQTQIQSVLNKLNTMEESRKEKDLNKLCNLLIQSYQYYTSEEKNPMQAWTQMESAAFWALFKDYEDTGGDGYMHQEVQPAMNRLSQIKMYETEKIAALMKSRR